MKVEGEEQHDEVFPLRNSIEDLLGITVVAKDDQFLTFPNLWIHWCIVTFYTKLLQWLKEIVVFDTHKFQLPQKTSILQPLRDLKM